MRMHVGFFLLLFFIACTCVPQKSDFADATYPVAYNGEDGKTAFELLKSRHQVKSKNPLGSGEFVVAIDGIKPSDGYFWAFYVNDSLSQVGASSYITKTGDKILWKIEEIKKYGNIQNDAQ